MHRSSREHAPFIVVLLAAALLTTAVSQPFLTVEALYSPENSEAAQYMHKNINDPQNGNLLKAI